MIIVTVKSILLEKYKEKFLQEFKKVENDVRKENGCFEYELYQKESKSSEFFLFERWESKGHVEVHLKTKHMTEFLAKTENWFESKEIKVYDIKE